MEPGDRNTEDYTGTIIFENPSIPNERKKGVQIEMERDGLVKVYYNPVKGEQRHRFINRGATDIRDHIKTNQGIDTELYVLINDIYDLQNIKIHLFGNYALSQDIDATVTKTWNDGKGFKPLQRENNFSFSGNFDGNGYGIKSLFINRSGEDDVGLFGKCGSFEHAHNIVENLTLENFDITGDHYVGSLVGFAAHTDLRNITLINSKVRGRDVAGGFAGTADRIQAKDLQMVGSIEVNAKENKSFFVGSARNSNFFLLANTPEQLNTIMHNIKSEKNYLANIINGGNSLYLLSKNAIPLEGFLSSTPVYCAKKKDDGKN